MTGIYSQQGLRPFAWGGLRQNILEFPSTVSQHRVLTSKSQDDISAFRGGQLRSSIAVPQVYRANVPEASTGVVVGKGTMQMRTRRRAAAAGDPAGAPPPPCESRRKRSIHGTVPPRLFLLLHPARLPALLGPLCPLCLLCLLCLLCRLSLVRPIALIAPCLAPRSQVGRSRRAGEC